MKTYIQAEIDAETVVQAMFDDSSFALDMWREINEKLHMGMLLDDCMDLVRSGFDARELRVFKGNLDLMSSSLEQAIELKDIANAHVAESDDDDDDEMPAKTPQECHFGIIENYDTMTGADSKLGIFISFIEDGDYAYDNMHNGLLTRVPDWLPKSEDMECHWAVPKRITKEQIMKDMTELGYTHKPEWDEDHE